MQHQDHFVAVRRQSDTQRGGQGQAAVHFCWREAIGPRRLNLAVIHCPDGARENFRGVGTGVQHERQKGAIEAAAEKCIQQFAAFHHFQGIHAGVEHQ